MAVEEADEVIDMYLEVAGELTQEEIDEKKKKEEE